MVRFSEISRVVKSIIEAKKFSSEKRHSQKSSIAVAVFFLSSIGVCGFLLATALAVLAGLSNFIGLAPMISYFVLLLWGGNALMGRVDKKFPIPTEKLDALKTVIPDWLASYGLLVSDLVDENLPTIQDIVSRSEDKRIIARLEFRAAGEERKSYTVEVFNDELSIFAASGVRLVQKFPYVFPAVLTDGETPADEVEITSSVEETNLYERMGI